MSDKKRKRKQRDLGIGEETNVVRVGAHERTPPSHRPASRRQRYDRLTKGKQLNLRVLEDTNESEIESSPAKDIIGTATKRKRREPSETFQAANKKLVGDMLVHQDDKTNDGEAKAVELEEDNTGIPMKRIRRMTEKGEGYNKDVMKKNNGESILGSGYYQHNNTKEKIDSDDSDSENERKKESDIESDIDHKDEEEPDPATKEEYLRQRLQAFYKLLRDKCNLFVCPVCAEEKSQVFFIKTPLIGEEDLVENHHIKTELTFGNNVIEMSLEGQKLLNVLLKDYGDPKLLVSYALVPFLPISKTSNRICRLCHGKLKANQLPRWSWKKFPFQPTPPVIKALSYMEKSLLSPIQPVVKLFRTYDGQYKMKRHALSFINKKFEILRKFPRRPEDGFLYVHLNVKFNEEDGADVKKYTFPPNHRLFRIKLADMHEGWKWYKENNPLIAELDTEFDTAANIDEGEPDDASDVDPIEERLYQEDTPDEINEDNEEGFKTVEEKIRDLFDFRVHEQGKETHVYIANTTDFASVYDIVHFLELAFPHLFPTGTGGPTPGMLSRSNMDEGEENPDSFSHYFKHLLRVYTRQYSEDPAFMAFCHSIKTKRAITRISASLEVRNNALNTASDFHLNPASGITVADFANIKSANSKLLELIRPFWNNIALKGTSVYWKEQRNELFTMLTSSSMPVEVVTFFHTLSAADRYWPELYRMIDPTLVNAKGEWTREVPIKERLALLSKNPVLATMHFIYRVESYFKAVVMHKSKLSDFEEVVDHWLRFEFQTRGSIHAHIFLWCNGFKNASKYLRTPAGREALESRLKNKTLARANYAEAVTGKSLPTTFDPETFYPKAPQSDLIIPCRDKCEDDKAPCADNYCVHDMKHPRYESVYRHPSCRPACYDKTLSDCETLFDVMELIKLNQTHIHTTSCYRKSHLPKAEKVCRYFFPRELSDKFQLKVTEYLTETMEIRYTMEIIHERTCDQDAVTNAYYVLSVLCWRSNIDLQYVANKWGAAVYACKYGSKPDKEDYLILTSELWHKLKDMIGTPESSVKKIVNTYLFDRLGHREISMQEIALLAMHEPLVRKSRTIQKINTLPPSQRWKVLKSVSELKQLDPTSVNVFKEGLTWQEQMLEAYKLRPKNAVSAKASEENCSVLDMSGYTTDKGDLPTNSLIDWEKMSQHTFHSWFKIKKNNDTESSSKGKKKKKSNKQTSYECKNDKNEVIYNITKRKKRIILHVSPHIPLQTSDPLSCYSVLFLHYPFRDETELLGGVNDDGVPLLTPQQMLEKALADKIIGDKAKEELSSQLLVESVSKDVPQYNTETNRIDEHDFGKQVFEFDTNDGKDYFDPYADASLDELAAMELSKFENNHKKVQINSFVIHTDTRVPFKDIPRFFAEQSRKKVYRAKLISLGLAKPLDIKAWDEDDVKNVPIIHPTELNRKATSFLREKLGTLKERQLQLIEGIVTDLENGTQILTIMSGAGGTGKTYTIQTVELLAAALASKAGGIYYPVDKMAPSGCAAFEIRGGTIQSRLVTMSGKNFSMKTLETLQKSYNGVLIVVIDEISLVSAPLFMQVDRRLQHIRGNKKPFGGMNMILAGDFFQLPPVKAVRVALYRKFIDAKYAHGRILFEMFNRYVELVEQNRTEDVQLGAASSLIRLGPGENLIKDVKAGQRLCDEVSRTWDRTKTPQTFEEALAYYNDRLVTGDVAAKIIDNCPNIVASTHEKVDSFNSNSHSKNASIHGSLRIWAKHCRRVSGENKLRSAKEFDVNPVILRRLYTHKIKPSYSDSQKKLDPYIDLAIGDRVMIVHNIESSIGFVNGAKGTVYNFLYDHKITNEYEVHRTLEDVLKDGPPMLPIVLVQLDNFEADGYNINGKPIPNLVPINPVEVIIQYEKDKSYIVRTMLPLAHAKCITIHKSQGANCPEIAIDPTRMFARGMGYVALSRAKFADRLFVLHQKFQLHQFCQDSLDRRLVAEEYKRLNELGHGTFNQTPTMNKENGKPNAIYIDNLIKRLSELKLKFNGGVSKV